MTETIEDMEKFVEERKESFIKNVFPVTDAIAKAIFNSKKLNRYTYGRVKCNLVHNGVHISFQGRANTNKKYNNYYMVVKYGLFGFRKVLEYRSYNLTPKVFHECEWIEMLDGLVEKIQQEDIVWKKKRALKKYKKWCKNLTKTECTLNIDD